MADPQHGGSLAGAVAGAYHLLNENGDVDSAHRLLVGAIEMLAEPGDAHNKTLVEALYTLLMVSFFGGRAELWPAFHTAVDRLRPQPPQLLSILPTRSAIPPGSPGPSSVSWTLRSIACVPNRVRRALSAPPSRAAISTALATAGIRCGGGTPWP